MLKSIAPLNLVKDFFELNISMTNTTDIDSIIGKSRLLITSGTWPGDIKPANGKTAKILNIFDPIIAPTAISLSPFMILTIEVTTSGKLVPIATIVRPIITSLTPK
jgi:hypothetical protein